ncbi:unnamed protein product, partial [Brachionus calyciflorus]
MLMRNSDFTDRILNFTLTYRIYLSEKSCSMDQNVENIFINALSINCEKAKIYKSNSKMSYNDIIYISEILNYITIVMIPIISIITIITNIMNLKILNNIKPNETTASNKLMKLNSLINLIYSVIYCTHLINKCIYVNGIFCSTILREKATQLFEVIFVEFFLSLLKIWSNVLIIGISWLRLSLLIKDEFWVKKCIKFQRQKKAKILAKFLFLISILISIDKLFIVRVNENLLVIDENYYEEFPNKNSFISVLYRDINSKQGNKNVLFTGKISYIFYLLNFVNFILNDVFIYLLMLIIDIIMVYYLKKQIKAKKDLRKKCKTDNKFKKSLENLESKIS